MVANSMPGAIECQCGPRAFWESAIAPTASAATAASRPIGTRVTLMASGGVAGTGLPAVCARDQRSRSRVSHTNGSAATASGGFATPLVVRLRVVVRVVVRQVGGQILPLHRRQEIVEWNAGVVVDQLEVGTERSVLDRLPRLERVAAVERTRVALGRGQGVVRGQALEIASRLRVRRVDPQRMEQQVDRLAHAAQLEARARRQVVDLRIMG